jgi:hypothetical protein
MQGRKGTKLWREFIHLYSLSKSRNFSFRLDERLATVEAVGMFSMVIASQA